MAEADDQSLKGLAKRWLKNQLKVGGDPMQGPARRREADELEWQMQHKVQEDVVSALTPKGLKDRMNKMEGTRAQRQAEQEQARRDQLATRTRSVSLTFGGDASGTITAPLPVNIGDDYSSIEIEAIDPVSLGGVPFRYLSFAIPNFHGEGHYVLGEDEDPQSYSMTLDSEDEPFYWVPEYGPAEIEVLSDGTVHARLSMQDPGGRAVVIDCVVPPA